MNKRNIAIQERDDDAILEAAFRKVSDRIAAEPASRRPRSDARDVVYGGTMPKPTAPAPEGMPTRNRRPARRKVSPFTIVVGLLLAAVASVLYISNVIAVGRLTAEIGQMQTQYQAMLNEQEIIRAQIARLSGLERIRTIAEKEYGMKYSAAVPGWLTVDPDRVKELEAIANSAGVRR